MRLGFGSSNVSRPVQEYKHVLKEFEKVFKLVEQLDEATNLSMQGLQEVIELFKKGQINKEELKALSLAIDSLNLDKEENLALKAVPGFRDLGLKDQVVKGGLTLFQRFRAGLQQDDIAETCRTKSAKLAAYSNAAEMALKSVI